MAPEPVRPPDGGGQPARAGERGRARACSITRLEIRLLLVALLASPTLANANIAEFLDDAAWQRWPAYCKAKHILFPEGRSSRFARLVPHDAVEVWERKLGPSWPSIHHYCWGLVVLSRAARETEERWRTRYLHRVVDEAMFVINNLRAKMPDLSRAPLYPEVMILAARGFQLLGQYPDAMSKLNELIRAHAAYAPAYSLYSIVYHEMGQDDKAIEILETGNAATRGESSEIQYFLGLAYLKRDELEKSLEHAKAAYRLGYPLPGLRERLKAKGVWK